jgi:hypothetical protein
MGLVILSLAVGALVTWWVARHYYQRTTQDLLKEAAELRRLNSLMLHGMEDAGWIKLDRDSTGKILGFQQIVKAQGIASSEAFGVPTVIRGEPKT